MENKWNKGLDLDVIIPNENFSTIQLLVPPVCVLSTVLAHICFFPSLCYVLVNKQILHLLSALLPCFHTVTEPTTIRLQGVASENDLKSKGVVVPVGSMLAIR